MQWPDVVVFVVAARNIHKELYKKSSSPPGKCGVCACCVLLIDTPCCYMRGMRGTGATLSNL